VDHRGGEPEHNDRATDRARSTEAATVNPSKQPRKVRRGAAEPARAEAREPRGRWPALPAASKVLLGSRLHHPPRGERDRHLSALLALGWEGIEAAALEDGDEAALGITAGDLAAWERETVRTPGGRRLLPHVEKAIAPFSGKGLKRSHLDRVMEALGDPDGSRYIGFQVHLQCETFRLVDKGQGDRLGRTTDALLAEMGLTFEAFRALKKTYGRDDLIKAEIAVRVLACITE